MSIRVTGASSGSPNANANVNVRAVLLVALAFAACGGRPVEQNDVVLPECRFPSGRVCPRRTTCAGEGSTSCAMCLCEVTGELTCFPRCDAGMD